MTDLQMLTQEEVATLLHTSVDHVAMLRRIGVLPSIKTGRNYMFSQASIRRFQSDYEGYDVSSMEAAKEAKHDVEESHRANYGNDELNSEAIKKKFAEVKSPRVIYREEGSMSLKTRHKYATKEDNDDPDVLPSGVRYWP